MFPRTMFPSISDENEFCEKPKLDAAVSKYTIMTSYVPNYWSKESKRKTICFLCLLRHLHSNKVPGIGSNKQLRVYFVPSKLVSVRFVLLCCSMTYCTVQFYNRLVKTRTRNLLGSPFLLSPDRFRNVHATPPPFQSNSRADLGNHLESKYDIDSRLHSGIFKALEPVYGPSLTTGHLDAFGKDGLRALATSVEEQIKKRQGAKKRPYTYLKVVIPHHRTSFEVDWKLGDSLLDVVQNHDELLAEYMEGTCGGNMSCCTCHVYIDQPEFQTLLRKPEESELDMLVSL